MKIMTNVPGLNVNRTLKKNEKAVSKDLEKLSSGYKINRAADDASGLGISEKMKAQITALENAATNCEDGVSLIQTAEGYLEELHNMLTRMIEIAMKSANGIMESTDDLVDVNKCASNCEDKYETEVSKSRDYKVDRTALQSEWEQLCGEIDRIGKTANFNNIKLFDGSLDIHKVLLHMTLQDTAVSIPNEGESVTEDIVLKNISISKPTISKPIITVDPPAVDEVTVPNSQATPPTGADAITVSSGTTNKTQMGSSINELYKLGDPDLNPYTNDGNPSQNELEDLMGRNKFNSDYIVKNGATLIADSNEYSGLIHSEGNLEIGKNNGFIEATVSNGDTVEINGQGKTGRTVINNVNQYEGVATVNNTSGSYGGGTYVVGAIEELTITDNKDFFSNLDGSLSLTDSEYVIDRAKGIIIEERDVFGILDNHIDLKKNYTYKNGIPGFTKNWMNPARPSYFDSDPEWEKGNWYYPGVSDATTAPTDPSVHPDSKWVVSMGNNNQLEYLYNVKWDENEQGIIVSAALKNTIKDNSADITLTDNSQNSVAIIEKNGKHTLTLEQIQAGMRPFYQGLIESAAYKNEILDNGSLGGIKLTNETVGSSTYIKNNTGDIITANDLIEIETNNGEINVTKAFEVKGTKNSGNLVISSTNIAKTEFDTNTGYISVEEGEVHIGTDTGGDLNIGKNVTKITIDTMNSNSYGIINAEEVVIGNINGINAAIQLTSEVSTAEITENKGRLTSDADKLKVTKNSADGEISISSGELTIENSNSGNIEMTSGSLVFGTAENTGIIELNLGVTAVSGNLFTGDIENKGTVIYYNSTLSNTLDNGANGEVILSSSDNVKFKDNDGTIKVVRGSTTSLDTNSATGVIDIAGNSVNIADSAGSVTSLRGEVSLNYNNGTIRNGGTVTIADDNNGHIENYGTVIFTPKYDSEGNVIPLSERTNGTINHHISSLDLSGITMPDNLDNLEVEQIIKFTTNGKEGTATARWEMVWERKEFYMDKDDFQCKCGAKDAMDCKCNSAYECYEKGSAALRLVFDFPAEFDGGRVVLDDDVMIKEALESANLGLTYDIEDNIDVYKKVSGDTGNNITFFCGAEYKIEEVDGGNDLVLQIGETSRSADKLHISLERVSAKKLGLTYTDVLTQDNANTAVLSTRLAVNQVSMQRVKLGAWQNRLEYTINNHKNAIENISNANSRIRDTDIAKTMATYTKDSILVQAAQAMLTQANELPQSALSVMA